MRCIEYIASRAAVRLLVDLTKLSECLGQFAAQDLRPAHDIAALAGHEPVADPVGNSKGFFGGNLSRDDRFAKQQCVHRLQGERLP